MPGKARALAISYLRQRTQFDLSSSTRVASQGAECGGVMEESFPKHPQAARSNRSIFRRSLHMVEDENLDRAFYRFQFEPELVAHCVQVRRSLRVGLDPHDSK
jgi:hypothetical protein